MKKFFGIFILSIAISACKTQENAVIRHATDSVNIRVETRVDSVWRDRWHFERAKGDTIFVIDSVFIDRFKYLTKTDSVMVRDSIPYKVEVPRRMRNGYDKFTTRGFWILLLLIVGRSAWWIFKKIYLHR